MRKKGKKTSPEFLEKWMRRRAGHHNLSRLDLHSPTGSTPLQIVRSMLCRCRHCRQRPGVKGGRCRLLAAHHLKIRLQPQLQGGRHAYEMYLQQNKQ